MKFNNVSALIFLTLSSVNAFAPVHPHTRYQSNHAITISTAGIKHQNTILNMAAEGKKKRRRRIEAPAPTSTNEEPMIIPEGSKVSSGDDLPSLEELKAMANQNYSPTGRTAPSATSTATSTSSRPMVGGVQSSDTTVGSMPDIRDVLKGKEMKKIEEEEKEARARPKISRRDKKAFLQVRNMH